MKILRIFATLSAFKTLIASAIIAALYYFMLFDDGTALELQIQNLAPQLASEEVKKKDTEATIKKEDEMQANLASLARDLQVVKAKLPSELKDAELTALINRAAATAGVTISSLARKNSPKVESKISGSESVEEVAFSIAIDCSFSHFVKFLELLAKEENIVKIRDFSIQRNAAEVAQPQIKFSGEIIGYKQATVVTK